MRGRSVFVVLALSVGLASTANAQAPDEVDIGDQQTPTSSRPASTGSDDKTQSTKPASGDPTRGDPSTSDPLLQGAPPLPSLEEVKLLDETDPRFARPILRRLARTAPDASRRRLAVRILARRDPSRATARICGRLLRIDPEPLVRREAAECLGRLPSSYSGGQTTALVAALDDDNVDVVTMAGWALGNVGSPESLGAVAGRVSHPDRRVGRLFLDYSERLRGRHGLSWGRFEDSRGDPELELVPPSHRLIAQISGVELTAATGWLAIYGGMAGWLNGGMLLAAHGGPLFEQLAPLSAIGGAITGLLVGGAYGFFRAERLILAHTVVQLGTMGTMVGYGTGIISGFPPQSGLNAAAWGVAGTSIGTGLGLLLAETRPPTPGALALGGTVALGTAVGFGGLAFASRFSLGSTAGVAMAMGGIAGGLTTVALAPVDLGILPCIGATLGGATLAAVAGTLMGAYESVQLSASQEFPFTAGSGWAVAAGYATGAIAGGAGALLLPDSWDPLLTGDLMVHPPSITLVHDYRDPTKPVPVAAIGGQF